MADITVKAHALADAQCCLPCLTWVRRICLMRRLTDVRQPSLIYLRPLRLIHVRLVEWKFGAARVGELRVNRATRMRLLMD
jgi:hypothetical protein